MSPNGDFLVTSIFLWGERVFGLARSRSRLLPRTCTNAESSIPSPWVTEFRAKTVPRNPLNFPGLPTTNRANGNCPGFERRGASRGVYLPGWRWARIKQLALVGSSSSLHSEACKALAGSDGVMHSKISGSGRTRTRGAQLTIKKTNPLLG